MIVDLTDEDWSQMRFASGKPPVYIILSADTERPGVTLVIGELKILLTEDQETHVRRYYEHPGGR